MVSLTQRQVDLLFKIAESGATSYVAAATLKGPTIVKCIDTNTVLEVDGIDWHELEAQDLTQPTTGQGYDRTNLGRIEYEERKNPSPAPRPVGFET